MLALSEKALSPMYPTSFPSCCAGTVTVEALPVYFTILAFPLYTSHWKSLSFVREFSSALIADADALFLPVFAVLLPFELSSA